jgi:transposase
MTRKVYPSDISREQFEAIRSMLENAKKKTNRRRVDLDEIFCAILYLLREGCRWRALPSDFPPVSTVRYYFDQWGTQGGPGGVSLLERALKKSGDRSARALRTRRENDLRHRRRAEREEHGHGATKRV